MTTAMVVKIIESRNLRCAAGFQYSAKGRRVQRPGPATEHLPQEQAAVADPDQSSSPSITA
jgi:hypothetical protein